MGGARQSWCPRCDELRAARPGRSCQVCGRELLAVPPARPGQPQPGRADRAARRLRAVAPAAGAVGVGVLVLAVVASAFAAGRLTRTTPSAPAAATASTVPGFLDEGPETGRRDFNWEAQAGGLTVELRSLTVGTGFTRLELRVDGVRRGREVSALERLRVRDADGGDLLAGGEIARIATAGSRPAPGGGIDTEVVLDRPIDLQAVAAVELGGLTVGRNVRERVGGVLVDRELRRRVRGDADGGLRWLAGRRGCPGCQLRVTCEDCATMRIVGSNYRRGRVLIAVEALDRVELTALNPSRRRVLVTDDSGFSELPAWIDGAGGTAVVSIAAELLAGAWPDDGDGDPMDFYVLVEALTEQPVRGRWTIRQAGG